MDEKSFPPQFPVGGEVGGGEGGGVSGAGAVVTNVEQE